MNTQEKRNILVKEIQEIPDYFLDQIAEVIHQLKNKSANAKYISNQEFEAILNQTSGQHEEVWKALA